MLNKIYVDNIIKTALLEDISYIDAATDYLIPQSQKNTAHLIAKQNGILCGTDFAMRVFELLDSNIKTTIFISDGAQVKKGDILAEINGSTQTILKGERTALNILQHLSGISTKTANLVALADNSQIAIAETRKTLPGLRPLQKYAVTVGGGRNHRFNLSDGAMIKDNHIDACGSISGAVNMLRQKAGHMIKIEVEVRNFDELNEAVSSGADVIMLDNMSIEDMKKAVRIVGGKAITEASGNITDETIAEVAKTGVDIISVGALTHSVTAFDISLKIIN